MKSLISLQNLTHAYWKIDAPADDSQRSAEDLNIVFEDFSLDLPPGIVSLMGENGIGKSTLLFLAGARLFPAKGYAVLSYKTQAVVVPVTFHKFFYVTFVPSLFLHGHYFFPAQFAKN